MKSGLLFSILLSTVLTCVISNPAYAYMCSDKRSIGQKSCTVSEVVVGGGKRRDLGPLQKECGTDGADPNSCFQAVQVLQQPELIKAPDHTNYQLCGTEGADPKTCLTRDMPSLPNVNAPVSCESENQAVLDSCTSQQQIAASACDKNSGENQSAFSQFGTAASALTQELGALTAGSVTAACSKIGQLSLAAN
ncbi:MAG: hypothetical protein V4736_12860, partial [Bdellovibrionota bacterium]